MERTHSNVASIVAFEALGMYLDLLLKNEFLFLGIEFVVLGPTQKKKESILGRVMASLFPGFPLLAAVVLHGSF